MAKLAVVTGRRVVNALVRSGFSVIRVKESHHSVRHDLDPESFRRKQPFQLGIELPLIDVLNWEGCGLRRGLRLGELRRRCGWSRSVQENGCD